MAQKPSNRDLMNKEMEKFSYKGDILFAVVIIVLLFGSVLGIIWWGNVHMGYLPSPMSWIRGNGI